MLNNTPFLGIFGYFYSYLMTKINNKKCPIYSPPPANSSLTDKNQSWIIFFGFLGFLGVVECEICKFA
ncbi:hypothetical protein E9M_00621 [Moraxella catarrhalis 46P47B1]|nr:hypothetical protein E9M_00621 [Moraxella catarrhalis 46P47B1]